MDRDERLMAYADGQLSAADRTAFEADMAADPALAEAAAAQARLRARLSGAYDPVLDEPVPLRLKLAAETANDRPRLAWSMPHWGAVAASLLAGVLVGRMALTDPSALEMEDGALAVRGELAQALDRSLAADAGPIRVGLSFRTADGRYCRTFQSAPDRLAGLACREEDGWTAHTTTAWTPSAGPQFRTAGAETPPQVLAAVDAVIAGEPLDAVAERAARARGWRP